MYCIHCGSNDWYTCEGFLNADGTTCKLCNNCGRHTSSTYDTPWLPPATNPLPGGVGGYWGAQAVTVNDAWNGGLGTGGTFNWQTETVTVPIPVPGQVVAWDTNTLPEWPTQPAPIVMTQAQWEAYKSIFIDAKKTPPRRADGKIDFDRAEV